VLHLPGGLPKLQWPNEPARNDSRRGVIVWRGELLDQAEITEAVMGEELIFEHAASGRWRQKLNWLRRFAQRLFRAHPLGPLGLVRKRQPSCFGPTAAFAHMREHCRFRLGSRLFDASEVEFQG